MYYTYTLARRWDSYMHKHPYTVMKVLLSFHRIAIGDRSIQRGELRATGGYATESLYDCLGRRLRLRGFM